MGLFISDYNILLLFLLRFGQRCGIVGVTASVVDMAELILAGLITGGGVDMLGVVLLGDPSPLIATSTTSAHFWNPCLAMKTQDQIVPVSIPKAVQPAVEEIMSSTLYGVGSISCLSTQIQV